MTTKDWILLLVPILSNGVLIVFLQKVLLEKYIRSSLLKAEITKEFLKKLKKFSDFMIQSNIESMIDPNNASKNVKGMQDIMIEIVKFQATNEYDLKKVKTQFDDFNNTWMCFSNAYQSCSKEKVITDEMLLDLGTKLQSVYDKLHKLIKKVRKSY